jgi:hypothetical protein
LSGGAIENALAIGANLSGGAFFSASTAVIEIGLGIKADTRTIGKTGGASAFSTGADLTAGAFSAASATVIEIYLRIDTRARASDLAGGAIKDA